MNKVVSADDLQLNIGCSLVGRHRGLFRREHPDMLHIFNWVQNKLCDWLYKHLGNVCVYNYFLLLEKHLGRKSSPLVD